MRRWKNGSLVIAAFAAVLLVIQFVQRQGPDTVKVVFLVGIIGAIAFRELIRDDTDED